MDTSGNRSFDSSYIRRYGRQITLPRVGAEGQRRLSNARALVVGAGGLGCPAAVYLVRAGIGKLGIIDFDRVEESNLHRQILHSKRDVSRLKAESAAESLRTVNDDTEIVAHPERFAPESFAEIQDGYDLVLDGSDNFSTKFMSNDLCLRHGKKLVTAGILKFEGQILSVLPGLSACYRCAFGREPEASAVPNCSEAGILGASAGLVGTAQAMEALKLLLGLEDDAGRLIVFDTLRMELSKHKVAKRADCLCFR